MSAGQEKNQAAAEVFVAPAGVSLTDEELATTYEGDHGTRRDLVSSYCSD
jgi:hypothetical protein